MHLQGNGSGADSRNPYEARLAVVRELHRPASERSCLHAELDVSSSQVRIGNGFLFCGTSRRPEKQLVPQLLLPIFGNLVY